MVRARRTQVPTGQEYGQRQQLEQAAASSAQMPDPSQAGLNDAPPDPRAGIRAPTNAQAEPLTAGMDFGPGPGPDAIQTPERSLSSDDVLAASRFPILELMAANNPNMSQRSMSILRRMRSQTPIL